MRSHSMNTSIRVYAHQSTGPVCVVMMLVVHSLTRARYIDRYFAFVEKKCAFRRSKLNVSEETQESSETTEYTSETRYISACVCVCVFPRQCCCLMTLWWGLVVNICVKVFRGILNTSARTANTRLQLLCSSR